MFKVVIELEDKNEKAWFRRGQACLKLKDFDTALDCFNKVHCLSFYLLFSVHLSVYRLFVYDSICVSVFKCLFVRLTVVAVCLTVCMSVCLCLSLVVVCLTGCPVYTRTYITFYKKLVEITYCGKYSNILSK